MFKIGQKVKCILSPDFSDRYEGAIVTIAKMEGDKITEIKEWIHYNWIYQNNWFEEINNNLMNLKEYRKIIKMGDKVKVTTRGTEIEGEIAEIGDMGFRVNSKKCYAELSPVLKLDGNWCYSIVYTEEGCRVELTEKEKRKFVKKRKAYVEITKEAGSIYVSLKIPEEVENFFKNVSGGETIVSKAWFDGEAGVKYYKQEKELEKKLIDIEDYIFSDFGSGLVRDRSINVAILRCVGVSKGVKIHSEGFSSLSNADLQDYVRRLGLYIKTLWESNISTTKIKSVITYEI